MSFTKFAYVTAIVTSISSTPAIANDARSIALGGSAISQGSGVHGVWSNPATLAYLSRKNHDVHLRFSSMFEVRDPGGFIDTALDNQDIVETVTENIDELEDNTLACLSLLSSLDTVCIQDTQAIGEDFQNILTISQTLNEQPFEFVAQAHSGLAVSNVRFPFAVHANYSVAAAGDIATTQNDIAYLTILQNAFIDGELTIGDIVNSIFSGQQILTINPNSGLQIAQPEDLLTSVFSGTQLIRKQLGFSFGYELTIADKSIDIGITPKFSSLSTRRASDRVATEFDDDTPSITELFQDAEITTTTFSLDAGATYAVNEQFAISLVARNLVPERAKTVFPSFTIDTTPQVLAGISFRHSSIRFNADAALNSAKLDGVVTHPFAIGAELGSDAFSFRLGAGIDTGRTAEKAALTVGFGVGPLQVGARVSKLSAIQAGAQLSYSF